MNLYATGSQPIDIKQEVRDLNAAARKLLRNKAAARKFILSLGFNSKDGKLKPKYR